MQTEIINRSPKIKKNEEVAINIIGEQQLYIEKLNPLDDTNENEPNTKNPIMNTRFRYMERKLGLSEQTKKIKLLAISSLLLFIMFLITGIATFINIVGYNAKIEEIIGMTVATGLFLIIGCVNGFVAVCLISNRDKRKIKRHKLNLSKV